MVKKYGKGNEMEYFQRLAAYIEFACFALISIIIWVFNWICWNRSCCFNLLDGNSNKVVSWWVSWVSLCGILACCISGFVTVNRFGFSLYGTQCAYERIYYDTMFGQYKETYPKWEGFNAIFNNVAYLYYILRAIILQKKNLSLEYFNSPNDITKFCGEIDFIGNFSYPVPKKFVELLSKGTKEDIDIGESIKKLSKKINYGYNILFHLITYYNYIYQFNDFFYEQLKKLNNTFRNHNEDLNEYKTQFIKDFKYYVNLAESLGKIVPLIFFSLLLTFVVYSGALLITYFCKRVNQQCWILPMHIAWNGLRFFIFFFFIYGYLYGMLFLFSKDSIAYLQYAFSRENLNSDNIVILPPNTKNFFTTCLFSNSIYDDYKINNTINEFLKNYFNFKIWLNNTNENDCLSDNSIVTKSCNALIDELKNNFTDNFIKIFEPDDQSLDINYFKPIFERDGNIYDNMNCSFIYNNINLMYRAMWDFSWETRILCALSCCIGFFGEIAVYSFLWVMQLWKRDGYIGPHKNKHKVPPPSQLDNI